MREHPIPQDVTGYKFHIVGNMTLKQFAEVGAGVLLAVILYNTNLLFFIKWPLIVMSVGLGAMMAFVPIEERPLDHWIITFFRRLYNPTKFYWRKESEVPFAMAPEKQIRKTEAPPFEMDLTPARQQRIRDYLASVSQPPALGEWESAENSRLSEIMQTFDDVAVETVHSKPRAVRPSLTPRVRMLSSSPKSPSGKQTVFGSDQELPALKATQIVQPSLSETRASEDKKPVVVSPTPIEVFSDDTHSAAEPAYATPQNKVSTNTQLPFPQRNAAPNTIMGMVLTPDNKLVDRAVVTIKNMQGKVIRALKTNLLGQFFATAPLPNGTYILTVEKEGLSFPEETLSLNGSALNPIELRAA